MKCLVLGAGLMGVPIAFKLRELGSEVVLLDENSISLDLAKQKLDKLNICIEYVSSWSKSLVPDVVVSAIPHSSTLSYVDRCINLGIRYCDLGGYPHISAKIHTAAAKAKKPIFTDLGLAPGLANILLENMYAEKPAEDVFIRVGGLPVKPTGSLNYAVVFNEYGLWNEYTGEAEVIENGNLTKKQALSDLEDVLFGKESLEAFNTVGGLSFTRQLMHNRGVKNCNYKTLRYPGHLQYIKFLLEECDMSGQDFVKVIKKACPRTKEDKVYIKVIVGEQQKELTILYDEHWTAMQKTTAFPTAMVAYIMGSGQLDYKILLDYSDVPFNFINFYQ